ncbi:hypothetical protein Landi51_07398 [Colletotrichum acutatum]
MGAADEDVNALSTAETKTGAKTHLPALNGASKLPYELVLDVMNHAILQAERNDFPRKKRKVVDNDAWSAVGHPRAALKPLVERMSKVYVGNGSFFTPINFDDVEILKSLPSLRRVDLDIGRKGYLEWGQEDGLVELEVGSGDWKIYAELFPDLPDWAENHESTFPTI